METKNLLNKKITQWLLLVAMLVGCSANAWAGGDSSGSMGVYLNVNGTKTWYKIYDGWGMTCSGWDVHGATSLSGKDLGTVTTLKLSGFAIVGWTDSSSDWLSGQVGWSIDSGSKSYYKVGNYGDCNSGKTQQQCSSGNNRTAGYKNADSGSDQSVDLLSGVSVGSHKLNCEGFGQMLWKNTGCGNYGNNQRSTVYAIFTVPGFTNVSESSLTFEDTKVGSSSATQSVTFTMYGSTIKLTTSSLTDFTVSKTDPTGSGKSGSVTVTFKPTTTGDKSETLTLTDNYGKTTSITLTGKGTPACTTPTDSNFDISGLTGKTYNGSNQAPTITPASGMGTMTVKYDGTAGTGKTNAGTYAITVAVAKGTTFCASTSDISLGNFVIDRASRTISITNTATTFCQTATPTVTSTVSAGSGDGTVTYTKTGGTATATVNSSTGVISCTAPGTVIVKASVAQGTNYSSAESTTKTFTFDASPSVGDLSIGTGGKSICLGSSQDITVKSYSGSLQWKQSTSAAGTYSNVTSGTGATSATYNTGNTSKTGNTYYKVEVSSGVCTPVLSNYTYISVKNVPTAAQYIMTNNEQTFGSVVAPTITPQTGAGTINTTTYTGTSGTSYGPSTTLPTAIGTYKVTVDVAKGTSYCATTGIELSNNFVIKSNCETPNPGVISGTTAICAGGSVSLTLSDYTTTNTSLLWYKNGVSTGVTTHTYSESNVSSNVTYTVKVSRTDVADCSKSTDNYAIPVTQIPTIATHTDGSRCGTGTVTLGATASAGDVNWYATQTGGDAITTGTSYSPNVSATTTYYVDATQNGCTTAERTAVTATVKTVPSIGSISKSADACGAGNITFQANSVTAGATVTWYENSAPLAPTGTVYTFTAVPAGTSHSVTAKATLNGCTSSEKNASASRLAVPTLTINAPTAYAWEDATFTYTSDGSVTGSVTQKTGTGGIISGDTFKGHVDDVFTGSYTATNTTTGCTTSDSADVTVTRATESCD